MQSLRAAIERVNFGFGFGLPGAFHATYRATFFTGSAPTFQWELWAMADLTKKRVDIPVVRLQ